MIAKSFEISNRDAEKRISSIIQHKLRIVMKCYTITNFLLSDENIFTFNKTHRIRRITINDKKTYTGFYNLEKNTEPQEDKEYILTLTVD